MWPHCLLLLTSLASVNKPKSSFIVAEVQRNAKCFVAEEQQREEEEEEDGEEELATIVRLWCFSLNINGNKS